ncbi:multisubunit potassium/proton antiporter PhaD subunit [Rhizobium sp. PP-WC-2G-219]|nr:multisubunit potassium/proton antiporter PhaD subunit [Rhizobium sp. PP-WC-2G-219]
MNWLGHLIILPILLPFVTAAALIPIDERRRILKGSLSFGATLVLLLTGTALMIASATAQDNGSLVYQLGNWAAPYGIVLVVDRLSAMMITLTTLMALCAQMFSMARWHKAGPHFHTLFQFMLVGVNGAFLTGDLFNLFVFFEIMLAASYGLMLHGSGPVRVKAGLHYIAINLAASSLFLIGVSLIYGASGTLNMADLALRIPDLSAENRMLLEAGAAVLGVAFLVKAGMWPLGFWLPQAYSAATPPVAAMFAILTKVGVYILLRLSLLLFGSEAGTSAGFGQGVLLYGGLLTVTFGTIGVMASQAMGRLASYYVLISSGSLMAAIGLGITGVIPGTLFYLISSTLGICAFFLLIDLVERARDAGADVLAVTMEAYGDGDDDEAEKEVGAAVPGTMAVLGICFVACTMLMAGLPPLSGFVAKFAILHGLFASLGENAPITAAQWTFVALLILSGLAALIALNRVGIRTFWNSIEGTVPRVRLIEITPVLVLLAACGFLTLQSGHALRYLQDTATALSQPLIYIDSVRDAVPVVSHGGS